MLSAEQVETFRRTGHLTVNSLFDNSEINTVLEDLSVWSDEFLASLSPEDQAWYLEQTGESNQQLSVLRKLDNPVFHRAAFAQLAKHVSLVEMVHQLIGDGVSVFFSQVFMKPPGVGGPKPIHQDNFYFGPDDLDATLTVWIALDDATTQNGCLYYSDIHQREVADHTAPEGEPYNLQMVDRAARPLEMLPAPVARGGISFHHGNTPHQSSANTSQYPRRATAFHYLRNDATLTDTALRNDDSIRVRVS